MNTNSQIATVEKQLTEILNDAAKNLKLNKYKINLNLSAHKGDGFMGEFYKVSITDEESSNTIHLVIKKAPSGRIRQNSIAMAYKNEISFYSEICPAFRRFEEEFKLDEIFNSVPGYITCNKDIENEMIVLKDITKQGYILREKDMLLDDEHVRFIFKVYGHFHALSFCMKKLKPEEFEKLTKPLHSLWYETAKDDGFMNVLAGVQEKAYEALNPNTDKDVIAKLASFKDNSKEIFREICVYTGRYSGIVHGDCWSNNMMFKYKDSQNYSGLVAMNLLDFQVITTGTPVYDLSYFLYTGGSKHLFDKLEEYLDVYYNNFANIAKKFGCDAKALLPRDVLSEEWKKYSKFGMMLAILATKVKLMSKEDSLEMIEHSEKQEKNEIDDGSKFMGMKCDENRFETRARDILIHMYEIGAL